MKAIRGVAQALSMLVILALLIAGLVVAFRGISGGPGAAPAATAGPVPGYPAPGATPSASEAPAQTQSGYPGPGATPAGVPSPTSILDTIGITPTPALAPRNDAPDQFDPKTYGLPDTIAGYKVLGVVTSENKACMAPGTKDLVLLTTEPTVEDYLKNSRPADVLKAMGELGLNTTEWGISFAGPGATRDQLITGVQEWNNEMEKYGCVYSGPAIPAPTSQTP
jgi:hypothetical protein